MKRMIKYNSTPQFREVVANIKRTATYIGQDENDEPIYNELAEMPKINFYGSIKVHGTNVSVVWNKSTDDFWCQSRENIITPEKDNAGFAQFAMTRQDVFKKMIKEYFYSLNNEFKMECDLDNYIVTLYGEWAGKGIQKGVGISEITKSFFIFGLKLSPIAPETDETTDKSIWIDHDYTSCRGHGDVMLLSSSPDDIWNISQFKQYQIEIDFNDPQASINKMIELTEEVEAECPVAKDFDISGIGEGIVWTAKFNGNRIIFKTKGEKHQSSKVKTLVAVDMEKLNSVNEFVTYAVTENRLNQAIEQVFTSNYDTPEITKMGLFLKWISSDVVKEELDVLTNSGLEMKDVGGAINKKAVTWFKKYLMENL